MLHICVLGNCKEHSEKLLKDIYINDIYSKPKLIKRDFVIMEDGTEYYALSHSQGDIRGRYLDQLIIANDELRNTEVYEYATYRLGITCVPEEFLIQVYNC